MTLETQYLALVSGVRMGAEQADMLRTQLLVQYLRGELGSLLVSHQVCRYLACNLFD
jgi:hypothetical protein